MVKRHKKIPPSRIKYEKNNPTVSARLPVEKRAKLLSVLRSLGLTLANLLIRFADETEIKLKTVDDVRQEGFVNGYGKGYEEARKKYEVTYPCRKCGKLMAITSPKAKAAAARYMAEHGWVHTQCPGETKPGK